MGREEEPERTVRIVDQNGRSLRGEDATVPTFMRLFDGLDPADAEHAALSVTDSDEWNLAVYPDFITFENVEEDEVVGRIDEPARDEIEEIVGDFVSGDFDSLNSRRWQK